MYSRSFHVLYLLLWPEIGEILLRLGENRLQLEWNLDSIQGKQ
jgi:hypothetical protein